MTFTEYLSANGINESTPGAAGTLVKIMAALSAIDQELDYRNLSLFVADLPELVDTFERLWYDYESALDAMNYKPINY